MRCTSSMRLTQEVSRNGRSTGNELQRGLDALQENSPMWLSNRGYHRSADQRAMVVRVLHQVGEEANEVGENPLK
jgi:hypothetical protein